MNSKLFQCFLAGLIAVALGCKRNADCISLYIVSISPYSSPVWYPDGSILEFNHIPLRGVQRMDQSPCPPIFGYIYF